MESLKLEIPTDAIVQLIRQEVRTQLQGLSDAILESIQKPEFESWGRYLNYDQTATYLGISKSGLKKRLEKFGITPLIFNEREKVFDRYDLERLKVNDFIENYKNNIK